MTSNLRAARALSLLALTACVPGACWNKPPERPPAAAAIREDFPATESTLSLLEPHGAQCAWAKLDAASQQRLAISTFEGDCRGGSISLSADRRHGAVWFDPATRSGVMFGGRVAFPEDDAPTGTGPRLFSVDMATGAAAAVPLPSGTRDVGFDPKGRLIALTVQELAETENAQELGFRSTEALVPRVQGDLEIDEGLLAKLARFAPQAKLVEGSDSWIRFGSGGTRFVLWEAGGELAASTGLAAFVDPGGNPVKPPGWPYTESDRLSYRWNGPYLLAAQDHAGTHPRLYRGGKLVWSSDTARAVTFWPRRRR
jgi:hypothetical protein